ncbi:uncharacterized protein HaLaN_30376 [Haematococcus lacustris]|uniref:Uncharacterized protein n=1 Tax=Haematococcus lacustris TaxID=44745 RepID=A0A6A0AGE1_HAELA|nr:uncharacterized protein HaLaN_30376 [Haematococcus lacustris]
MSDQLARWKLTKGQVKHDSGLNNSRYDTERWLAPIKPHLQHLAAASSAGTSLEANLKHITVTLATWDAVWEVYLDPKWARQRLRLTPPPAKRSKRTKAEQAADPTQPSQPTKGKGKGKAAKAKPAPQPGRWADRDCNAALNMQRVGESRWRPLELCWWPNQAALPAKGKEYPGLGATTGPAQLEALVRDKGAGMAGFSPSWARSGSGTVSCAQSTPRPDPQVLTQLYWLTQLTPSDVRLPGRPTLSRLLELFAEARHVMYDNDSQPTHTVVKAISHCGWRRKRCSHITPEVTQSPPLPSSLTAGCSSGKIHTDAPHFKVRHILKHGISLLNCVSHTQLHVPRLLLTHWASCKSWPTHQPMAWSDNLGPA